MYKIDKSLSLKLARLSFVAAVMVVIQHMYAPFWDTALNKIICHGLVYWDVPYFFFAAGLLLFKDFELGMSWYYQKIKSRVTTIVIPYFLWHALGCVSIGLAVWLGLKENSFHFNSVSWWLDALGLSQASQYAGHLWFLRRLMFFVAISPLLAIIIRRIGFWMLPTCLILYLLHVPSSATFSNLAFFSLGACIALRQSSLLSFRIGKGRMVALAAMFGISLWLRYMTLESDPYIERVFEFAVRAVGLLFFWFAYDSSGRWSAKIDRFSGYSFFIYCCHSPILVYIKNLVYRGEEKILRLFDGDGVMISAMIMLSACILSAKFLIFFMPRVYAMLSGGRGK